MKKRITKILSLLIAAGSLFMACDSDDENGSDTAVEKKLVSIMLDTTQATTEYTADTDAFSAENITITAGFSTLATKQPNSTQTFVGTTSGVTYSTQIGGSTVTLKNGETTFSTAGTYTVKVTYTTNGVSASATYSITVNTQEAASVSARISGTVAQSASVSALTTATAETGISLSFWLGSNATESSTLFTAGSVTVTASKLASELASDACYATISFNDDESITYYKNGTLIKTIAATDSANNCSAFITAAKTGITANSAGISMTNLSVASAKNATAAKNAYQAALATITKLSATNVKIDTENGGTFSVDSITLTATDGNATWEIAVSACEVGGDDVDTETDGTYYVTFSLETLLTTSTVRVGAATIPDAYWSDPLKDASADGVSIVGSGSFVEDATFGTVFKNVSEETPRTNYLRLPNDLMSGSAKTNELTVGFWVKNTTDDTYLYHPLFACYAASPSSANANTYPMMIAQARGLVQVNCDGWSDYEDGQNDAGKNTESIAWLSDGDWHYYTAVFTATTATVYIDGEVMNSWTLDGTSTGQAMSGLFTSGSKLVYNCLGGNQAWNWDDPDSPYSYAKFSLWTQALNSEQIETLVKNTKNAD